MVKNQNDFDTKGYVPIKSQMGGKKNYIKENYYIKSGLNGRVETFELSTINGSSIFA
jgi:hypothetical protein